MSGKANKTEELTYVIEPLRPLTVHIDTLVEDPANTNTHDERSIRAIMGSLARYKQRTPLVVNVTGNVVEKGRHSKWLPKGLLESYQVTLDDPGYKALRHEIAARW